MVSCASNQALYSCNKVSNAPPVWMHWIFRIANDIDDFVVFESFLSIFFPAEVGDVEERCLNPT